MEQSVGTYDGENRRNQNQNNNKKEKKSLKYYKLCYMLMFLLLNFIKDSPFVYGAVARNKYIIFFHLATVFTVSRNA